MPPVAFEPTMPASERLENHALGRGYTGARTDKTQQSGQTPDKEVDINRVTVYVSGYIETDPTGVISSNNGRLSDANKVGLMCG